MPFAPLKLLLLKHLLLHFRKPPAKTFYAGSGIDGGVHGEGAVVMEVKTVVVQDWGLE